MGTLHTPEFNAELFNAMKRCGHAVEEYPVHVPLLTGGRDYDPVLVVSVFQKKDGNLALIRSSYDSSWDSVQSIDGIEIFPTLNDLFKKHPQLVELVTETTLVGTR
jgi:hypothetical protein